MSDKKIAFFTFLIMFFLFDNGVVNSAVKKWEVFEIELTAKNAYDNPYVDGLPDGKVGLVQVLFTGTAGEAKGHEYTVSGFWDGGQIWKVRFAPPLAGTWLYKSSSVDAGLNSANGSLVCEEWTDKDEIDNYTRRGFVRVCKNGKRQGRYFEYADGTPFLWIGDTWWGWSKKNINFSSFKMLVDNRVEKGFTIGQLFVPGNGGNDRSVLDETYNILDVEHMKLMDERIKYANSSGMTVWVHGWWAMENLDKKVGAEKIKRWCRYLIHRLGAYNVIWTLCGEYTLYNCSGFGLQFWKNLGKLVDEEDPYERLISVHPNPSIYNFPDETKNPYFSTGPLLHNEEWLDYNQSQVGHSKWRNEMIPSVVIEDYARVPAKPIVVTEPWYEFIEGNPNGDLMSKVHSNIVEEIIFGGWSAILSGAAGHSYGGGHIWRAHLPETPEKRAGEWPMDMSFKSTTLDYPGAFAIGHLAKFFKYIRWWELEPHPELVSNYPQKFCSAVPGKEYVVFMRYGGGLKLDIRPSLNTDIFEFIWFDPRTGKNHSSGTVNGGSTQNFIAPGVLPTNRYMWEPIGWVLYVKKKE